MITGIRIFLTDNRKRQSKKLALEFFEQNRTPLREIYLRYPPDASTLTDRNSDVATSFSVLIVRFLLSGKDRTTKNRFLRSSSLPKQILDLVYVHPARARHLAATCLPETLKLIESDIRAFDKNKKALLNVQQSWMRTATPYTKSNGYRVWFQTIPCPR